MSRPFGTAVELERRRRRAIELLDAGEEPVAVAHFLGVDRSSVYRWRQTATRGPNALPAQPHPHRPPQLTDAQLCKLDQRLAQGAAAHGRENHLCTTQRVAIVIERHFKIRYHHDHAGRVLRQRLNWSVQKPYRKARERNENAIRTWQSETFPRLAREASERGSHLIFLDESGFFPTPNVRRTWAPRGQTPILHAWDRRDRISAISSITVSPKNQTRHLYFDLMPDNTNVRGENVVNDLRRLKANLGGPMTIPWDGSRAHGKSKAVLAVLARNPGVRTERIPAYAPDLNPDELVWAWAKYHRLCSLAAQNTAALRDLIDTELKYPRRHPELLESFTEKPQPESTIRVVMHRFRSPQ